MLDRKRDVRIKRLEGYTTNLFSVRALQTNGLSATQQPTTLSWQDVGFSDLFSNVAVPATLRRLPASPFLVPAVLDVLSKSPYAAITEVVPGEGETFCANHVRVNGGIALTGDSDMLVYDLGTSGVVAFFKQLECRQRSSDSPSRKDTSKTCKVLVAELFKPKDIAQRLGLENLQRLAFEIKTDSHLKIQTTVRRNFQPPKTRST